VTWRYVGSIHSGTVEQKGPLKAYAFRLGIVRNTEDPEWTKGFLEEMRERGKDPLNENVRSMLLAQ